MANAQGEHRHLEAFLEMLAAERGAAVNTLQAYRRDLEDFLAFLDARAATLALLLLSLATLVAFISAMRATGIAAVRAVREDW